MNDKSNTIICVDSYIQSVIEFKTPNADTIQAMKEVEDLKNNPSKKIYTCFDDILLELEDED